jgi:hypothetical protein
MKSIFVVMLLAIIGTQSVASQQFSATKQDLELRRISRAIVFFKAANGHFPSGRNFEIVQQLTSSSAGVKFAPRQLDEAGNLLDLKGRPYVMAHSPDGWFVLGCINETSTGFDVFKLLRSGALEAGPDERSDKLQSSEGQADPTTP